ncbi:MAG TPA: hypothetical protein VMZ53_16450 [Kofleriaceae bacterium]|nr:hypothetical protein [Kofleriaceae bacterium]
MVDDPAVRSVRVAAALCDRFAELLKGPTIVTAHKGRGALIGIKGNEDDLSLRLGEAQQIYPEIWSHLDEARKAFGARGVALPAFDALRETERQFGGTGAGVDMKFTQYGDPTYGMQETVKKANFNQAGLARARSAIQAITLATPDIDWASIEKAEANDPHAKAFRRATIIKRIWMFGLLIAVIGIPFWWLLWSRHKENEKREKWRRQYEQTSYQPPAPVLPPTPPADLLPAAEQAELANQAAALDFKLAESLTNWEQLTAPAVLAKLKAGSEPCAYPVTPPPKDAGDDFIKTGDNDTKVFAPSDFMGYLAKDGVVPSDELYEYQRNLKQVLALFEKGAATARTKERWAVITEPFMFVLIDRSDEPEILDMTSTPISFKPGRVTGRAYVFSIKDGKMVCTGAIDAKSSPPAAAAAYLDGVTSESVAGKVLHRELEVRIREGLANLKAVAP